MTAPAGWYPEGGQARYWNGTQWTDERRALVEPAPSPSDRIPDERATESMSARRTSAAMLMGGAVAVAIGCFMPWIKASAPFVGTITRSGVDDGGDGVILLVLAAILALIGYGVWASEDIKSKKVGVAIIIGVMAAVTIYDVNNISESFAEAGELSDLISTSYGAGIVLVGLGIGVAAIGWLRMPWSDGSIARKSDGSTGSNSG